MRITVYAGSSRHSAAPFLAMARSLGEEIARRRHELVYGGGGTGLMGELAEAALAAGGRVRGVILDRFIEEDAHHPGVTLETVSDMRSRKAGLDAGADAFVALPGGLGTLEELAEVLSFRKLGLHRRPIVLINAGGFYDPFLAQLERAIASGFEKTTRADDWRVAENAKQAIDFCEELHAG